MKLPIHLPDSTRVEISLPKDRESPTLVERLAPFVRAVHSGGWATWADNDTTPPSGLSA